MKLIFIILLFPLCANAANNYYVDNSGSDANSGTSAGTAWQHISKVNGFTFSANDTINFRADGTWNEQLIVPAGVAYIRYYNTGNKPLITGFYTATGFTEESTHIWSTTISNSAAFQNTVKIDGLIRAKGRYPNTTFSQGALQLSQYSVKNYYGHFTDSYVGGQLVYREFGYIIDAPTISAQSGDTLTLNYPLTYNTGVINPFFIENTVNVLDTAYEWSYDSISKKLYIYSLIAPTSVQYSIFDTLVKIHSKNNVVIDGLQFTGANKFALSADTLSGLVIKNCLFNNNGNNGIQFNKVSRSTIDADSIMNTLSNGIFCRWQGDSCTFKNIYFNNSGMMPGMLSSGQTGSLTSMHLFSWGNNDSVYNNHMDNCGYIGNYFQGQNQLIKYNYITNYCQNKSDGGAIYGNGNSNNTGTLITNNITSGSLSWDNSHGSGGVYLDNNSYYVSAISNTIINTGLNSLQINGGNHLTVTNNTIFSNSTCLYTDNSITTNNSLISNNIFYSSTRTYPVVYTGVNNGVGGQAGLVQDTNYIIRSNAPDSLFRYGQSGLPYYSFINWKAFSSLDAHSTTCDFIADKTTGVLYINPTLTGSIQSFTGSKIDAKGNIYNGSVTVAPFQSALLFTYSTTPSSAYKKRVGTLLFQ